MAIHKQLRRGIQRLISWNSMYCMIVRDGDVHHNERLRISTMSNSVWGYAQNDTGAQIDAGPIVVAKHTADIQELDIIWWGYKAYQVGAVTIPDYDGMQGVVLQAPVIQIHAQYPHGALMAFSDDYIMQFNDKVEMAWQKRVQ